MTFLYIHGFNSDGEGWKAQALRRQFPTATVLAPDLPADPQQVMALLNEQLQGSSPPFYLVGTSLGGFYAYCLSAHYQRPALLFNPSLSPYLTLKGRGIGHFQTWTKQRDYHFQEAYLQQLEALKVAAETRIQPQLLRFFLADDDDVLDHSSLPTLYPESDIRWYSQAGHGFRKFEKILKSAKKEGWL
ncbi:MAG: YqiA/YcfP family alpha/beta fold hydrolase [Bacteroidota bacterium]